MKPFIQDGHTLVLRAVRALIGTQTRLVVELIETTDWASATFVGKRHRCGLRVEGSDAEVARAIERLTLDLAEIDVVGSGHFLADCVLADAVVLPGPDGVIAEIVVEALTIED